MLKYFKGSIVISIMGMALVAGLVWYQSQSVELVLQALMTAGLLSVLEVSLSFDNAVVNATVMKTMSEVWKKRFLTWGMLIAVFGMRLIFPVLIVSIMASIGPVEALKLSIYEPAKYAEIMTSSHLFVASFGGMFLFMVFLHFFMNEEKDIHWISFFEKPMSKTGNFKSIEIILSLLVLVLFAGQIEHAEAKYGFVLAGLSGMVTYMIVHGVAEVLEGQSDSESAELVSGATKVVAKSGLATFLYLEVLDASFSFDGVIGAFALTNSLFLIMIGLGIGAFFVRSLTIYFVEKNTVENFKYLEHGAFYALGALAIIMLLGAFVHIPEWVTGLSGFVILGLSVLFSLKAESKA